jgi:uncharacterized protein YndB with AHSA1/START domain
MTRRDFDPGPLADVHTVATDDRWTVVFVRHLPHPPAAVWTALTEPGELAAWAPFLADRDLATPGPATLTVVDGDERQPLPAQVMRSEAPSLLEYTWGDDVLRWELAPDGTGTRLTLRHTMYDRDFLSKTAAGWHLCLVVADRLLAGDPVGPIRGAEAKAYGWDDLEAAYAKALS